MKEKKNIDLWFNYKDKSSNWDKTSEVINEIYG